MTRALANVSASGYSSGKVIVSGEHSAVYDQPALVSGISLGVTVEVVCEGDEKETQIDEKLGAFFENIQLVFRTAFPKYADEGEKLAFRVHGDLPIGVGLGSSAALAHATLRALIAFYSGRPLSSEKMIELIQQSEQFVHGHPSGLDALGVVMGSGGRLFRFQRNGDELKYSLVETTALKDRQFFLIHSGQPQETTKETIALVRQSREKNIEAGRAILEMGALTEKFIETLEKDMFAPKFLTENERLLEKIGVVGEKAKEMIGEIEKSGGFAKVTGAGGLTGGSGMLLAYHPEKEKMTALIEKANWVAYPVTFRTDPDMDSGSSPE